MKPPATPSQFPPDERPTTYRHRSMAVEAYELVRDWRRSPRAYQLMMLRLAARGAKLPKKKP
jgi:hypothetical protein